MWIVVIIVVFIFIYALIIYNSLVSKKNKIKQAYSGIDVYLTQRFDLIPNLVARRIYNMEVNSYNNTVQMFPSNIFANMFGFHEEEFFEAEEPARNNVEADL